MGIEIVDQRVCTKMVLESTHGTKRALEIDSKKSDTDLLKEMIEDDFIHLTEHLFLLYFIETSYTYSDDPVKKVHTHTSRVTTDSYRVAHSQTEADECRVCYNNEYDVHSILKGRIWIFSGLNLKKKFG
jgi:hypothetical protein